MKAYYMTFRSVTLAQQAEMALARAGISCALQRTPRWMETQGCGYCLRIPYARGADAVTVLRREQATYRKIYLKLENGTLEEVQL